MMVESNRLQNDPGQRGALFPISRRGFLSGLSGAFLANVSPATAQVADRRTKRLTAGTRMLEVNGRSAGVFSLTGPDGRQGLRLGPGERFRVNLANETGAHTIVHWHGQLPPWQQDGFPWLQTPPFASGTVKSYDYEPIPGTYWMHSHHGLQEQNLLTAPLIIEDAATRREDRQDIVLMLGDFTFRSPTEVLAGLTETTVADARAMVQNTEHDDSHFSNSAQQRELPRTGAQNMTGMAMPGMKPDLNDVQYDAFLANDRTLADPEIVRVERGGRVRLRIINGASSSQFWIDLGKLTGRVIAADGHAVEPVSGKLFPLATAQRLDFLIDLPAAGTFPILARLEGTRRQTGIVLTTAGSEVSRIGDAVQPAPPVDSSLETQLAAANPLPERAADISRTIVLDGSMKPYAWSMNGEYWPHVTPLMLSKGQRVEIELVNRTMMSHPIHLHGHAFQVVAIEGKLAKGAIRDTVLVPARGSIRFAFDADNPGRWAFHCHLLYHMMTGMLTEFRYQGIST